MENKEMLEDIVDAGYDIPTELDRQYEDVVPMDYGNSVVVDRAELRKKLIAFNQHTNPLTRSGCGWYGLTHCENAMRIVEDLERGSENQTDPAGRWIDWNRNERPEPSRWRGTSLQSNLNIFRNKGRIAGYAYANPIEESKRAIDNGHFIYTGSNRANRPELIRTKVFTPLKSGTSQGHLFMGAYDYTDEGLIAVDSYGPDRGEFLVPRDTIPYLYSRIAVIPVSNADLIANYRNMTQFEKEFQKAIALGITNGERPEDGATRKESAVMNLRAKEKAKAEVMQEVHQLIEDKFTQLAEMVKGMLEKK